MKRFILISLTIVGLAIMPGVAHAYRCFYDAAERQGTGAVIAGATVSLYLAGTSTPAKMYTARTETAPVYSITSAADGTFSFYVDRFDYDDSQKFKLVVSKTGYASITKDNVDISSVVLGNYTISMPITVTTSLNVPKGVKYLPSGTGSLTINGPFQAGLYQVFDPSMRVTFGAGTIKYGHCVPQLWGARGDGSADDTNAMTGWAASCPAMWLPTGDYYTDTITITKNARTIRGENKKLSRLVGKAGKDVIVIKEPAVSGVNWDGLEIANFSITSKYPDSALANNGITITSTLDGSNPVSPSYFRITDINCQNLVGYCIKEVSAEGPSSGTASPFWQHIERNISSSTRGFYFHIGDGLWFRDNVVATTTNGSPGVYVNFTRGSASAWIVGNVFSANTGDDIQVVAGDHVMIKDNRFEQGRAKAAANTSNNRTFITVKGRGAHYQITGNYMSGRLGGVGGSAAASDVSACIYAPDATTGMTLDKNQLGGCYRFVYLGTTGAKLIANKYGSGATQTFGNSSERIADSFGASVTSLNVGDTSADNVLKVKNSAGTVMGVWTNNIAIGVNISGTGTSYNYSFSVPEKDDAYYPVLSVVDAPGPAPAANSHIAYITNKSAKGFTINLLAAPGAGATVSVFVMIVRRN